MEGKVNFGRAEAVSDEEPKLVLFLCLAFLFVRGISTKNLSCGLQIQAKQKARNSFIRKTDDTHVGRFLDTRMFVFTRNYLSFQVDPKTCNPRSMNKV